MIVPTCPLCGDDMTRRSAKHGEFWGCTSFPGCRGTRQIWDTPEGDDRMEESMAERDARTEEPFLAED